MLSEKEEELMRENAFLKHRLQIQQKKMQNTDLKHLAQENRMWKQKVQQLESCLEDLSNQNSKLLINMANNSPAFLRATEMQDKIEEF